MSEGMTPMPNPKGENIINRLFNRAKKDTDISYRKMYLNRRWMKAGTFRRALKMLEDGFKVTYKTGKVQFVGYKTSGRKIRLITDKRREIRVTNEVASCTTWRIVF